MNLRKILSILVAIIAGVGVVLWVLIVRADEDNGPVGIMINLGKWLVIIAAIIALIFTLKNIISDGQKLKKTLISVIAFIALAGVSYALASGTAIENVISERASRLVGAGIYFFYLLAALAILIMIFYAIRKTIK